jgi:hypothetical protein
VTWCAHQGCPGSCGASAAAAAASSRISRISRSWCTPTWRYGGGAIGTTAAQPCGAIRSCRVSSLPHASSPTTSTCCSATTRSRPTWRRCGVSILSTRRVAAAAAAARRRRRRVLATPRASPRCWLTPAPRSGRRVWRRSASTSRAATCGGRGPAASRPRPRRSSAAPGAALAALALAALALALAGRAPASWPRRWCGGCGGGAGAAG